MANEVTHSGKDNPLAFEQGNPPIDHPLALAIHQMLLKLEGRILALESEVHGWKNAVCLATQLDKVEGIRLQGQIAQLEGEISKILLRVVKDAGAKSVEQPIKMNCGIEETTG